MSIQIYILDASGNLESQRDSLRKYARSAVRKARRKILLDNIDIIIRESERPELWKDIDGVGGWCPTGHFIQLSIDKDHPSLRDFPEKIIENTLLHELHHAARMQAGVLMSQSSFLEYMFSEGLADYFVYELTGKLSKWVAAINPEDTARLLKKVKEKSKDKFTNSDHQEWFILGSEERRIPQFAGYAVGFEIVKNHLARNPDRSAASLVGTPVEDIPDLL